MLDLINPQVDEYLGQLVQSKDPVLVEMEAIAEEHSFPIIGPQVGRFLHTLAVATGARRVLELGSGYGYSAFFFATAVGEGGKVILTEYEEENAERAREFLKRAGLFDRAEVRVGDGLLLTDDLERAGERFDIIFNDTEKEEYPKALGVARRLLRPGGMLICDNMLWYGRVLDPDPEDADTAGVVELTRQLYDAADFITTLIPMRDGVTISLFYP